jgi:branched-subunit amino acid ABC-type transport system permease component
MFDEIIQSILTGILLGSLYSLLALGLTLTLVAVKIYNWAYAEFVTVGAYVVVLMTGFLHTDPFSAVLAAAAVSGLLAIAVDESVFKPLIRRGSRTIQLMVASIAAGLTVRYVLLILADYYGAFTAKATVLIEPIMTVGIIVINTLHVWVVPSALGLVVLLHLYLTRTRLGKQIRAMADNFDLARVTGISIYRVRRATWMIAGALSGIAGAFWSMYSFIEPESGWILLLTAFAATIVGGLTSPYGSVAAAYLLGITESTGIFVLHKWFGVPVQYKSLLVFLVMVGVLLIRPQGLASIRPPRWISKSSKVST